MESTNPQDEIKSSQLEMLAQVFCEQLMACLDECGRGRKGLFSDYASMSGEEKLAPWPEAAKLRELALALQGILAQDDDKNALCDEFLDLCSMHGECHPGEQRLARAFLGRIERGEVGTQIPAKKSLW